VCSPEVLAHLARLQISLSLDLYGGSGQKSTKRKSPRRKQPAYPESVDFDPYDFQLLVLKEITKIPARDFTSLLIPQVPHPSGSHQEDP
jgi:hypothetical protein